MFRKKDSDPAPKVKSEVPQIQVTSILGANTTWKGTLSGEGGVRIEGSFEGEIDLDGLVVVDAKGKVTSEIIKAHRVIIAGAVRSDIQADKVEIRSTGRVWGDVTTVSFATEEGAYLRGKIQMEEASQAASGKGKESDQESGLEQEPEESPEDED
jgi:cytoskeletal protein CcmA (bactofilin family)